FESFSQSRKPNGPSARVFLSGWLAFSGLCVPLFGRAFSVLGLHTRIVGFLLILLAMVLGAWKTKSCRSSLLVLFFVALHFVVAFLYADPDQVRSAQALSIASEPYAATKLSRMLVFNGLPVLMGFLLSRVAVRSDFREGVVWAMVTWSIAGLVVGVLNSDYWFSPVERSGEEWESRYLYSTIGMTLVLIGGFLTGLVHFLRGRRRVIFFLLLISCFALIIAYAQRAAWIYCLLASLFLVGRTAMVRPSAGLKTAMGAAAVFLFGILFANEIGAVSMGVMGRAEGILEGHLFDTRAPLYLRALSGFWEHPLGQGLASFSRSGGVNSYPHNILLEALYELGVVGGIVWAVLLAFLVRTAHRLIRAGDRDLPSLIIGLYLGYVLLFNLKSGDLITTDLFFATTLLFSCPRHAVGSGEDPGSTRPLPRTA
ncbi:MAG: O-antigen ligase family protein, partial [Thermodesulfobacteriota bacterium]